MLQTHAKYVLLRTPNKIFWMSLTRILCWVGGGALKPMEGADRMVFCTYDSCDSVC